MSQIGNSTGSSYNIVQSSMKVRYSDLVDFSDQFSYINIFHIIYGLKDMNFQSFSNFQTFAHGKEFFAVSFFRKHTAKDSLPCMAHGKGPFKHTAKNSFEITKTLKIHIF